MTSEVKKVCDIFTKKYPKKEIKRCIDFNEEFYIVEAYDTFVKQQFGLNYYSINKFNNMVGGFVPTLANQKEFFKAVKERTLFCRY